jgi:hypothetical protein
MVFNIYLFLLFFFKKKKNILIDEGTPVVTNVSLVKLSLKELKAIKE